MANITGLEFEQCGKVFVKNDDVEMIDSALQFDIYHFKVMELTTYEDNQEMNKCRERFNFMHRIIREKK